MFERRDLQGLLPSGNLLDGDIVEHTVDTGIDKRSHDLSGHTDRQSAKCII